MEREGALGLPGEEAVEDDEVQVEVRGGGYDVNKSKTVPVPVEALRAAFAAPRAAPPGSTTTVSPSIA